MVKLVMLAESDVPSNEVEEVWDVCPNEHQEILFRRKEAILMVQSINYYSNGGGWGWGGL